METRTFCPKRQVSSMFFMTSENWVSVYQNAFLFLPKGNKQTFFRFSKKKSRNFPIVRWRHVFRKEIIVMGTIFNIKKWNAKEIIQSLHSILSWDPNIKKITSKAAFLKQVVFQRNIDWQGQKTAGVQYFRLLNTFFYSTTCIFSIHVSNDKLDFTEAFSL